MGTILKATLAIVVVLVVVFLLYAFSPLLYDVEVNEDFPVSSGEQVIQEMEKEEETTSQVVEEKKETESQVDETSVAIEEPDSSLPDEIFRGVFQGADAAHKVSGEATIYELDSGERVLRFEDFMSTNGPDLKVYLATDTTAQDFVSLGELKGNKGNQNYDVPVNIDLEKYDTVLIWCERFGVHFGNSILI